MKSCEHCSHEDCKNIGGTWYCLECPECGVNWKEKKMKLYKNEDLCIECKNEFFSKPYDHRDPTPGQLGYCIKCDNFLIKDKKMEFDKSRVFTAVNADELRAGDKVCVADTLMGLQNRVRHECVAELEEVLPDYNEHRFKAYLGIHNLAYLVERKENCTNCAEGRWDAEHQKILCDPVNCGNGNVVFRNHEIEVCEYYKPISKMPKTEQKAEEKNCYNCRLTYTRDGVMRCMMNDHRCNNPEVACNHYEPTTFEKHYRPFRDTDELIKVWCEKGGKWQKRELTMPLVWVRYKDNKHVPQKGTLIRTFFEEAVSVDEKYLSLETLFKDYEFLDGSICGVEE